MSPEEIVRACRADGLSLSSGKQGNIVVRGNGNDVDRWLPYIRDQKPAILVTLEREKVATAHDPRELQATRESGPTAQVGFVQTNLRRIAQGLCPWCGGGDWWKKQCGERACRACHPPPHPSLVADDDE